MAVVLRPSKERKLYVEEVLNILKRDYNIRCGRATREKTFSVYGHSFRVNAGDYVIFLPEDTNKRKLVYDITTQLHRQGIETYLIDKLTLAVSEKKTIDDILKASG